MKTLKDLREIFWPVLVPLEVEKEAQQAQLYASDLEMIGAYDFGDEADVALDEARRMADEENDRRKGADQKAATYLAVVAALVPLILSVATSIWDKKSGSAPTSLNMALLGLAVAYVSAAGYWAFQVLEVQGIYRLAPRHLRDAWIGGAPANGLARKIVEQTRKNYAPINEKVTRIKMAHVFLLRAFLTFALLLMANILFYFFDLAFARARDPWLSSARSALVAEARVDQLEARLATEPAAEEFARLCRARDPAFTLRTKIFSSAKVRTSPALSRILRVQGDQQIEYNRLQMRCGTFVLGEIGVWKVAARSEGFDILGAVSPSRELQYQYSEVRTVRRWPPAGDKPPPAYLPTTLIEQQSVVRDENQFPIAYLRATFGPGALGAAVD